MSGISSLDHIYKQGAETATNPKPEKSRRQKALRHGFHPHG